MAPSSFAAAPTGFCGTCRMVVDLTYRGRLTNHGARKLPYEGYSPACEGTGELPSPLPPEPEDPVAAFHTTPPIRECSVCGRDGIQLPNTAVVNHHRLVNGAWCEGGGKIGTARPR